MSVRQIQLGIASIFFILGGWALFAPQHVIDTVVLPRWNNGDRLAQFTMACFGAQACLAGLFIAFSQFRSTTFLVYGLALVPFFVFNFWFTVIDPIFNMLGLIDALGNAVMLALCCYGWARAKAEEAVGR